MTNTRTETARILMTICGLIAASLLLTSVAQHETTSGPAEKPFPEDAVLTVSCVALDRPCYASFLQLGATTDRASIFGTPVSLRTTTECSSFLQIETSGAEAALADHGGECAVVIQIIPATKWIRRIGDLPPPPTRGTND